MPGAILREQELLYTLYLSTCKLYMQAVYASTYWFYPPIPKSIRPHRINKLFADVPSVGQIYRSWVRYEKIVPELIQGDYVEHSRIIGTLRTAPDFAIINNEMKAVRLVEVKYRRSLNPDEILKIALRMQNSWNPSYLFLFTLDGFYFNNINKIVITSGRMAHLSATNIPEYVQASYLQILRDFEAGQ